MCPPRIIHAVFFFINCFKNLSAAGAKKRGIFSRILPGLRAMFPFALLLYMQ